MIYLVQQLVRVERGRDGTKWMDYGPSASKEIAIEQCANATFNLGSQGPWRVVERPDSTTGEADVVIWPPIPSPNEESQL
jgi:hypothetical protein